MHGGGLVEAPKPQGRFIRLKAFLRIFLERTHAAAQPNYLDSAIAAERAFHQASEREARGDRGFAGRFHDLIGDLLAVAVEPNALGFVVHGEVMPLTVADVDVATD